MRVLAGPRVDLGGDRIAATVARGLAGPADAILSLRDTGVRDLGRPLSRAEVDLLRTGLRGDDPVVGYLCRGSVGQATDGRVVVVTDHADLTWRSPLTGPNDPAVGPRFPSMTGIYSPNAALDRLSALKGMILMSGVVAGVRDDARVTAYEAEMVTAQGHVAVSSELVPVVVVAAHMGPRVAAVLLAGS